MIDIKLDHYQTCVLIEALSDAVDYWRGRQDRGDDVDMDFLMTLIDLETFLRVKAAKNTSEGEE